VTPRHIAYHFTHVNNLTGILETGELRCVASRRGFRRSRDGNGRSSAERATAKVPGVLRASRLRRGLRPVLLRSAFTDAAPGRHRFTDPVSPR
jgi:hypothetical protein